MHKYYIKTRNYMISLNEDKTKNIISLLIAVQRKFPRHNNGKQFTNCLIAVQKKFLCQDGKQYDHSIATIIVPNGRNKLL